jgi:hypothetical protein
VTSAVGGGVSDLDMAPSLPQAAPHR